jgi:prepilin peptidase CpaA
VISTAVFVAVVGYAGWTDLRTRRIPNWLTLTGLLVGLALRAVDGLVPLRQGVAGAGAACVVGMVFFLLGALGGGDGKLLIAVGAFLGIDRLPGALLLIGVLGGLLGIGIAVRHGVILPSVLNAAGMIRRWVTFGRSGVKRTIASPGAVTVPYGAAIALGAIVWWFWEGPGI